MLTLFTIEDYASRIEDYFAFIKGEYHIEKVPAKGAKTDTEYTRVKVWDRDAEPATLTGLALHLGFNSREEFEAYEINGPFAALIKRAKLRVECEYEKKLHYQSSTGAVFVLKSLGWKERPDDTSSEEVSKNLEVTILETGPQPVFNEKDVSI